MPPVPFLPQPPAPDGFSVPMHAPLPTPAEMAAWDRRAIDHYGLRGEMLMENAARAALAALRERFGALAGARVLVFCGSGNNGGDGFALARALEDAGAEVRVLRTKPQKAYRGEARHHLDLAQRRGVRSTLAARFDSASFPAPDIVVDALLGTGFSGELGGAYPALVEEINRLGSRAFVFSLDCPSGLDCLTGLPRPEAVRARLTAAFHAAKLGLALPRALEYVGELAVCEIGIPTLVERDLPPDHLLVTSGAMARIPAPDPAMHKGTAGRVLVVGGSPGLTGAAHLAARAALRAGAGMVTLACPAPLEAMARHNCPDIMTLPLEGVGGGDGEDGAPRLGPEHAAQLAPLVGNYDAVAVGPGMGRHETGRGFLAALLPHLASAPCVLDADALYHLCDMPGAVPPGAVLTPHPGEMARLLGRSIEAVEAERFAAARTLAETTRAVAVLKGPGTVVAPPRGALRLVPLAAPNLAVGGSGDVLCGVVAALLAGGMEPLPAACVGVYWHGITGQSLHKEYPGRGNLASELADALPRTR
ncbi:MAG: NAD(P)H-hydrate dehydratase [Desulfovibrionaceae bacterium]